MSQGGRGDERAPSPCEPPMDGTGVQPPRGGRLPRDGRRGLHRLPVRSALGGRRLGGRRARDRRSGCCAHLRTSGSTERIRDVPARRGGHRGRTGRDPFGQCQRARLDPRPLGEGGRKPASGRRDAGNEPRGRAGSRDARLRRRPIGDPGAGRSHRGDPGRNHRPRARPRPVRHGVPGGARSAGGSVRPVGRGRLRRSRNRGAASSGAAAITVPVVHLVAAGPDGGSTQGGQLVPGVQGQRRSARGGLDRHTQRFTGQAGARDLLQGAERPQGRSRHDLPRGSPARHVEGGRQQGHGGPVRVHGRRRQGSAGQRDGRCRSRVPGQLQSSNRGADRAQCADPALARDRRSCRSTCGCATRRSSRRR